MISREDIDTLATLARLELTDAEKATLEGDISNILAYVGQVAEVSSDDAGPVAPPHRNVLRVDEPRAADDPLAGKEAALRDAFPKKENGFAVVRKILQKDE